jgi:hypothetical protein
LGWHFVVAPYFRGDDTSWPLRFARVTVWLAVLATPFLIWLCLLHHYRIPNPFDFSAPLSNRHSGGWGLLFTKHYTDMFVTWVITRGLSFVLFGAAVVGMWKQGRSITRIDSFHGVLFAWGISILPFWALVRRGSSIHDYYVLQYALPLSILGAEQVLLIPHKFLRYTLVMVSLAIGLYSPIYERLRVGEVPPHSWCEMEVQSLMRFPLR